MTTIGPAGTARTRATIRWMVPPSARPIQFLALALAGVLVLAACGSTTPTSSPTATRTPPATATPPVSIQPTRPPDPAAVYAAIEQDVQRMRGLTPRRPVTPQLLDETALRARIRDQLARDNPPERIAAEERLLKGLGLFPMDASYEDLVVSLLGSQVAGFYDPATKEIVVVSTSGTIGPVERTTFVQEYTHALQDQAFGLDKLDLDRADEGDRSLARLALIEGDATLVMSQWIQERLTPEELLELVRASNDPEQARILVGMPAILRETLLFPYTGGLQFVLALQAQGGWAAVDRAYANPPASTEQILHPEKYRAGELPVPVQLPDDLAARMEGSGWRISLEDTVGELQLRTWLREVGRLRADAAAAAAMGWGGDRVMLLEGPKGAWAIVLRTAWDTRADADAFAAAVPGTLGSTPIAPNVMRRDDRTIDFVAGSSAEAEAWLTRALGYQGD